MNKNETKLVLNQTDLREIEVHTFPEGEKLRSQSWS